MKTQLSKPARARVSYTDQYKQEALGLWRASGRSAAKVASELGIRPPLLYRWARLEPETAPAGGKSTRTVEQLEAEIRRLRAENAKLLEQREVLKKSLAGTEPPLGWIDQISTSLGPYAVRGWALLVSSSRVAVGLKDKSTAEHAIAVNDGAEDRPDVARRLATRISSVVAGPFA